MEGFAAKAKAAGPMIGAAFAAAAVGFVAMSVKMAAAEEAVSRQTEALLKSKGIMWGDVSDELNTYMKGLEELTAYNDTDLQIAFNAMIAAGMSYTEAMESMNTVTSMSFSLNRDLASMALLVGKAYNGQTGELSRYGIVLDETLDKYEKFAGLQEYVADNFADASDRAGTFEGQMAALKNETSNFAEALGTELLPDLTDFVSLLVQGADESESFATKLGKLLAIPFKEVTRAKTVETLAIELHELEMIKKRTHEEDVRRSEIIFEMQQRIAGTWVDYEAQKMAQSELSLTLFKRETNELKNQTNEMKNQTAEIEKQLSMRERAAQSQSSVLRNIGGTSSMSAGTAALIKSTYGVSVSPGRINSNITGGNNSGV